jgi:hypothetical protein
LLFHVGSILVLTFHYNFAVFFSWGHLSLAIGFKAGLRDSVQAAAPDSITGAALMKG